MTRKPRDQVKSAPKSANVAPSLFIRLKFGDRAFIGPGKVQLLELIGVHGSISAAGRAMGMSYRRAWLIVDGLNSAFRAPLVMKQTGGSGGGGAVLTELGREIVERYRRIERDAEERSVSDLKALADYLA
jgi:molybdate transport system regulatory protein